MMTLLRYELFKTFAKWRTYIGFLVVAIVIPLVLWGLKLEGGNFVQRQMRQLQADFLVNGNLFNAWTISQIIMNSLWVHVPFLISLVAGDQLAGEATAGTFRLILIRPVSRARILNAKYAATLIYTATLVLAIALFSIGLGMVMFGSGDILVMEGGTLTILPESQALFRFALAYALAIWSMWVVASLAFLFSSFVENAIGPIISTMGVIIVLLVVSNLHIAAFESIRPYLFTTHESVWQQAFADPIDWRAIASSCAVLGAYSAAFWAAALVIFRKKDILS